MRILIAEDQKLLRDCIRHMIEGSGDIEVVACVENGIEAIEQSLRLLPDVILMDIVMPLCDGIEATKKIKEFNRGIKVVMLTTSSSYKDVGVALKNGADGYVLKSISSEELLLTIRSVYSGLEIIHKDVYINTEAVDEEKERKANLRVNDISVTLSERDRKIIALLADGKSTAEIAGEMFLTEGRIRNIITEIIAKLCLKDRAQLIAFAFRNNLVQ